MASLTINGIDIPIVSAHRIDQAPGEKLSTIDGVFGISSTSRLRQYEVETAPMTISEYNFIRHLVAGDGHYFDTTAVATGTQSSKGVRTETSLILTTALNPYSVANYLYYTYTSVLTYALGWNPLKWTFIGWWLHRGLSILGGGWRHYVVTPSGMWKNGVATSDIRMAHMSDGTDGYTYGTLVLKSAAGLYNPSVWQPSTAYTIGQYVHQPAQTNSIFVCTTSGTSSPTTSPWHGVGNYNGPFPCADGTAAWQLLTYNERYHADWFIVPYVIDAPALAAKIYTAHAASKFSALPLLNASGDIVGGTTLSMRGLVSSGKVQQSLSDYRHVLTFTLTETPG